MPRTTAPRKSSPNDPIKEATITALKCVVDPLIDLMFDAGITVHELTQLVRERAVRSAARRVAKESGRDSKSRVAIMTGLPRSEVARILKSDSADPTRILGQHPARQVLSAWFDNPRFLTTNGDPAVLPIFGKRRSFERLVALHSRGIPVRAMLDELTQLDAVERLPDQRIRVKCRIPISTGLTGGAVAAIGDRTRDLLATLTNNLRCTSGPLFEGTAIADSVDIEKISLVRREIAEQAANFINGTNSLLSRSSIKSNQSTAKTPTQCRLGVTVYYFQDDIEGATQPKTETTYMRRKNLQRHPRPMTRKRTPRSTTKAQT